MAKKDLTKIPNYNNVYKGAEYYSFSDNLDKQAKADKWFELFRTNQKERPLTKKEFDEFMDLSKELAWEDFGKGGVVTYKDKYNTKYGYAKNASHTLEEVSKDTGVSMKGLQQIYNKGIGAYKTNPSSVRPNVKSKEQWAMARVYSAVMGGKTARIDANELKMAKGGNVGQEITCQNCGWHWNTKNSADFDKYVCHKCDYDNSPFYSQGGQITNYTEFYDNLIIEDGSKYIGQKFNDVFPFLSKGRQTPHDYRLRVKQYEGEVERLKQDNYTTPSRKTRDLNKLAVHKKTIDKYKYLSRFFLDPQGTIIKFMKNNEMEKGGINWYGKGGIKERFAEGGQITQYEIESMRNYINSPKANPKLKDSFQKVLSKFGVDLETSDLSNFPKGKYIDPYDFEGYEYMRNQNEEAGVYFLLTGEYQLVSKSIYEKDYAMWLFYNYLGRINISLLSCKEWLQEAVQYFSYTLPVPINLVHTPNAKDGRSFAQWYSVSDDYKITAEGKIGRRMTFEFNKRWYYNEIGLVANGDYKGGGWGSMYQEKKTGLLIPEYTETSFHLNTLIHEFAHCLDFQTQLVKNIEEFNEKISKSKFKVELSDLEKSLYSKQIRQTQDVVSDVIGTHFDTFVDSLIRILRACAGGHIPLTQLFEQQALNVQQTLSGTYGDLLLAQRERKAKERAELQVADELRDNKRFTWQSAWNREMKAFIYENAIQQGLKEKLDYAKKPFNLAEIIELDNILTRYIENDFYAFQSRNPSKSQERFDVVQSMRIEANRIINNHYDNIKKKYAYGFVPSNELEIYLSVNCGISDFRDYKSWKECSKQKLIEFQ
jgi:hypothetical protein